MSDLLENEAEDADPIASPAEGVDREIVASAVSAASSKRRATQKNIAAEPTSPVLNSGKARKSQSAKKSKSAESRVTSPAGTSKSARRAESSLSQDESKRADATPSSASASDAIRPSDQDDQREHSGSASRKGKPVPIRNLTIAAAVALALGGVLFASWPDEKQRSVKDFVDEPLPADKAVAASLGVGLDDTDQVDPSITPVQDVDSDADTSARLSLDETASMRTDAIAAATSLSKWFDAGEARQSTAVAAQDGGKAVMEAQALPPTPAANAGVAASAVKLQAPAANEAEAKPTPAPASVDGKLVPAPLAPGRDLDGLSRLPERAARLNIGASANPQPLKTLASVPKWISGGPTDSDNRRGQYKGSVVVQFTVSSGGRATDCVAVRPSGDAGLDALTCRIVVERARFTPARDPHGRSVSATAHASYVWGRRQRTR